MVESRPTTEIGAANLALAFCKQPGIAAFPPVETNLRAREAHLHFGAIRDALLVEHPWAFCKAWMVPAGSITPSLNPLLPYRYPLPGDCLEVRSVADLGHDEWEIEAATSPIPPEPPEQKVLSCTRPPPIKIEFTLRVVNVALWEPLFLQAFALRLASAMAPKLTRNEQRALELLAEAEVLLKRAQMSDRRERARSSITRNTHYIQVRK